jgi:hypothetical protein
METRRKERMRRDVIKKHTKDKDAPETESLPRVRKVKAAGPPGSAEAEPARASQKALPFTPVPDVDEADEPEDEGDVDEPVTDAAPVLPVSAATRARKGTGSLVVRGDFPLPPTSIMDEIKVDALMDKTRLF